MTTLALQAVPAAAQFTPPPVAPKVPKGGTVPTLPPLAKIESVTWSGTCGKAGNLVVTIRNTGGMPIRCHGLVSISRGTAPGGAVAGTAEFTGLGSGETKTFTILVERVFNCCPHDCYLVTMIFDPDCAAGQPWDRSGRVVCVGEPSHANIGVTPLAIPH